jgi:hypothetical protein
VSSGLPKKNKFNGAFEVNEAQVKFLEKLKSQDTVPLRNNHVEVKFRLEKMVKNRASQLSMLVESPLKKTDIIRLQKACTEEKSSHWRLKLYKRL